MRMCAVTMPAHGREIKVRGKRRRFTDRSAMKIRVKHTLVETVHATNPSIHQVLQRTVTPDVRSGRVRNSYREGPGQDTQVQEMLTQHAPLRAGCV